MTMTMRGIVGDVVGAVVAIVSSVQAQSAEQEAAKQAAEAAKRAEYEAWVRQMEEMDRQQRLIEASTAAAGEERERLELRTASILRIVSIVGGVTLAAIGIVILARRS